jgi:hypothetical protein
MKKNLLFVIIFSASFSFAQTHSRKTRSDKGKKHSHTLGYTVKKAIKPKSTATKSSKKK